ncbi:Fibropellin-1 [Acropora cervicornis]|uniref:Fibropellin-1 n=1 Tax=Acropora cervicornis TaxID=6130 RepID=A0AAD9Q8G5_ACRCE|nr:Fibropellin-1 [Acropora cervicornis]
MASGDQANTVTPDLSGTWYNELGSKMIIDPVVDGVLKGTYLNNASDSSTAPERLIGSCGIGVPATFGFVVNFRRKDEENEEVLLTTWLMTSNLGGEDSYWEATNVGQDRFTRYPQKQPKQGRKLLAEF